MEKNLSNLYKQFNEIVYSYILRQVKNPDEAKDILQDAFIKINSNLIHLKKDDSLRFWIFRIVRNTVIDHFRKKKFDTPLIEDLPENEITSDRTSELAQCILPFINNLPEKYKEALILTEFKNYSQLELSKHLNISYSGAKSRVQRAKVKLRELFEQCCKITSDPYGNIIDYHSRNDCCD